ncbi:MAG: discoidin domain-containing protein [Planctomycetota bacterium]
MKTAKILISMIVMVFMAGISVQAEIVTYDFDDGTLQGWSNLEVATEEEFVVRDNGQARSPNNMVIEDNFGDRDSDTIVKVLTSPAFWISATTSMEIWALGGIGAVDAPTWTNYSNLPAVATDTDFMGAALRRMSDDEYLLFSRRSQVGEGTGGYEAIGWDAPTIAAAVAGDSPGEQYVVDIIDTFTAYGASPWWAWIGVDDITLTDVVFTRPTIARGPYPEDGADDVSRDVVLNWTPGEFAAAVNGHTVYLSKSFNDVNDGIGGITQSATNYDPGRLNFGATYYWRVDEVNAPPDSTVFNGDVWSFTTEPIAYPIGGNNITATASSSNVGQGPENTVNRSGLDLNNLHSADPKAMWISEAGDPGSAWIQYEFDKPYKLHEMLVWNYNGNSILTLYGLKEVTIEYSTNGTNFSQLENIPEFAQAIGDGDYAANTTVAFNGAVAKYVIITANSNWGDGGFFDQYGLSEIQFLAIPVATRKMNPADETILPGITAELSWRAGRQAEFHDVYISTDMQAVIDGLAPVERVNTTQYTAEFGLLGTTYYWKVNEVNEAEVPAVWEGPVQSLTTSEFLVIENFDDYSASDNQIWWSWKDGLGYVEHDGQPAYAGNGTGSAVGDETTATFMEMNIVQGGTQSMPVWYDNNKQDFAKYSETALTLPAGKRDWTAGSPVELSLWFRGEAANIAERLYVAVADTAVVYHEDLNAVQLARWTEWVIPLETLADQGVSLTDVDSIALGLGTRGNATIPGGAGKMYFDEIRLHQDRSIMVPITVPDAGFDDQVVDAGGWAFIGSDYPGPWQHAGGDAWIDNGYWPDDDLPARSGDNKLYGNDGTVDHVYQILDETFVEGAEYTLSVWVGIAWSGYDDSWSLYFTGEDYSDELISIAGNGPVGEWGQASLVYTATAADAGKKIGIKMQGAQYVSFEDVTLFQSAPAVTVQPDPEENLTVNPSFESPDLGPGGTGQWADNVDGWIINTQGNCYLEDGSWEIVAPDGVATLKMWNGAAIWQQIGNVSPNTEYEISMFIGRGYDTSAVQVELWAGGDPSALPASYGIIGDTVAAALIGGASLIPTIEVGQNELMGLSLNTGADFGLEDALWIRIESIGGDGTAAWVDNVMVTIP